MNGHVFECYNEQSDRRQYAKTLEALEAHVKKVLKFPEDLALLFAQTMEAPTLVEPAEPDEDAGRFAETIYLERMKQFWRCESELLGNMATMHAVIWGQCSKSMKARLRALTGFKDAAGSNDCFWMLQQIKSITLQFNEKRYGTISLLDARWNMLNCRQEQDQSVAEYKEILKGWADAIDFHGGTDGGKVGRNDSHD